VDFRKWTARGNVIDAELASDLARLGISVDEFTEAVAG
jgi:hypothetical protein